MEVFLGELFLLAHPVYNFLKIVKYLVSGYNILISVRLEIFKLVILASIYKCSFEHC